MSQSCLPLARINVVEFAGLAPAPLAGLILADFGANVIRIDRPSSLSQDILCRGKRSVAIDVTIPSGHAVVRSMIQCADVLIEPYRPGVMERLGLGPEEFLGDPPNGLQGINNRLIYARLSGFPRDGSHNTMAGHDLNYLALSGVLSMLPGKDKPTFPLNILSDFAGGGVMCVVGVLLALLERNNSGVGQVVNTDMVQGLRYLSSFVLLHSQLPKSPFFSGLRGTNVLDGGAPFYDVYTCSDGGWMTVACIERKFFQAFLDAFLVALPSSFSLDGWRPTLASHGDKPSWPKLRRFIEGGFRLYPRNHWTSVFQGTDACTVPVLSPAEATTLLASGSREPPSFVPNAHPHLARTPSTASQSPAAQITPIEAGEHTREVLAELGLSDEDIRRLARDGALGQKNASAKL